MLDRKHDPFFEQLKADIQVGIDQADRGETIPLDESMVRFGLTSNSLLKREAATLATNDRGRPDGSSAKRHQRNSGMADSFIGGHSA